MDQSVRGSLDGSRPRAPRPLKCHAGDRHRDALEREPFMMYRCRKCKEHVCGFCHGTTDEDRPPLFFNLCDDCWVRHERRAQRRAA